ncbi:GNAT family N-acetyltransferase [Streptomyces sp. SID13031]|uniref:GNAT family N-acetyltransferase n=1 Tax=Streptomyces sp. SID13031 TaxID=2706046 RepID=UPI0013CC8A10|nr:GNAT family N-acetyltransferase [Streptomyces sp. SID13031]NEA33539.1 GNAT family N-acetyltransferase [Streptomyces sp. SID13031]
MTTDITIRATRVDEVPRLRSIEKAAGVLFHEIGMTDVAEHPPPSLEIFEQYQRAGLAWTAAGVDGQAVGFVLVKLIDGAAHIEQVSTHPDHARQGIGRRLIDEVDRWAAGRGLPALTLSTFRDIGWNGPYYARLGFRELTAAELTPGLAEIQREETAMGLDPAGRVLMRREIETGGVSG